MAAEDHLQKAQFSRVPLHKVLSLKTGDYPEHSNVRAALPDIHEKIETDYEDAGDSLRAKMAAGIQPGHIVVNNGQLDDGHRRVAIAHELGWTHMTTRSGEWGNND